MSMLVQDLIVSVVAFGAVTMIGWRARAMFVSKRSGAPCGSCTKCPTTATTIPSAGLTTAPGDQARIIRLTVIPGGR
jgi:hypothetical protein